MKKITLFIALLCSISTFSARYLIQLGNGSVGAATWTATSGGTVVNLATVGAGSTSKSLNEWYADKLLTTPTFSGSPALVSGDEIWLAAGTYVTTATLTFRNGVSVYGGFAGTELAVANRNKISGGKNWEFSNPTIIDGNNASRQGIITAASTPITYIDGLTITKYSITAAAGNITGVGAMVMTNWIMQNCIVSYNTFTNSTDKQCRGAGVYLKGGQLLNSYVHHNSATKGTGTGTGTTYGGGVAFVYNASPATTVKGCNIESNVSTAVGGGMVNLDGTGGVIEDCIFQSNSCPAGNGGAIGTSASTGGGNGLTLKNNQFIENTAGGSGGAVYYYLSTAVATSIEGCSFIGNVATPTSNGGGGLCLDFGSFAPVKNCIFRDNKITNSYQGSALFVGPANTTVQNCVFANNTCSAANMHVVKVSNAGCKFLNCTFANNLTSGTGSALSLEQTVSTLSNCVFWNNYRFLNVATMVYRDVYGYDNATTSYNATDGGDIWGISFSNNIKTLNSTTNNTFVTPTTFQGAPTDASQKAASAAANWSLKVGCPAINTGTDLAASGITTDILGNVRPTGTNAVDRGAYESIVVSTSQNASSFASNSTITVSNGGFLIIDVSKTLKNLTINSGGKVTNNIGQGLTASTFTINSDATGTGTYVDNEIAAVTTATVQQYLPQGRNWYVASPIETNVATANNLTVSGAATSVSYYNEEFGWQNNYTGNLTAGVGYVAVSSSGIGTNNISFSGKLNSGDVPVTLTRKSTGSFAGFNLIANPYPSYVNPMSAINANSNLEPTIWYRTRQNGGNYKFETVNTTSGVGTNLAGTGTVTGYIPPMQAFWVRTNVDDQTLTFTNVMRDHAHNVIVGEGTVPTTSLKAPKQNTAGLLRLKISNSISSDEAVIYFNENAQSAYDKYDSPKMFENIHAQPEIYTKAGSVKLVINGLNDITQNQEIVLGFTNGEQNNLTLKATELPNLDNNVNVYLRDNVRKTETELTPETKYAFASEVVSNNEQRFSILFRAAGVATGFENNPKLNVQVFVNATNQITIIASENLTYAIYNSLGQKQYENVLNASQETVRKKFFAGIYFVELSANGQREIQKVIIR